MLWTTMSNKIFDISAIEPSANDVFFVDTNVWYWLTYASSKTFLDPSQEPQKYQTDSYPSFIQKAMDANSKLYYSPLSLAELANTIERKEYEIFDMFNATNNNGQRVHRKKFRKIASERKGVVQEVDAAWAMITTIGNSLDCELTEKLSEDSLDTFKASMLDPYDSFFFEIMKLNGLNKIITDDIDFDSANGLEIFTANKRLNK